MAIASLLCVLLNLAEIAPWYFPPDNANKTSTEQPIRLFSFNVLGDNKQYAKTISYVESQEPTIAVFLEAGSPAWQQQLQVLQKVFPYYFVDKEIDIQIYSKVPLKTPSVRIFGTYRGLVASTISINGREVLFIAAHAYSQYAHDQEGFEIRNQQLLYIGNYFQKNSQPVVLVGDLNVTMWSPYYKSMIRRSGLENARAGFGILPTHSYLSPTTPWLAIPIDHCLVSSDIEVKDIKTGPNLGSDHLPLITDVAIAD